MKTRTWLGLFLFFAPLLLPGIEIPARFEVPVLVISYFPTNAANIDVQVTGDCGEPLEVIRQKTLRQTAEIVTTLQEGSRYRGWTDSNAPPALHYKIAGTLEYLGPLPTFKKPRHKVPMTDYAAILKRMEIERWVQQQGVKEVWIWGYHGGKVDLWESNMSSPYGDASNSDCDPSDLPLLDRTYTVYHYNYTRGTSEAIEDHMHQIEAVLNHVDGRDRTPPSKWAELLFWGKFVGSDRTHKIVHPGCGWAHYPPNGERDYDWANPRYVETDMDDWKPDGTGQKTRMNCERWQASSLNWFIYWMQHLPGPDNHLKFEGKTLNNWWVFIGDYDFANKNRLRLVSD